MPVIGNLGTMSLVDLLRWAGGNQKTGVLELERNKICRRVEFRKGWIGACSSNEPSSLLGQFLLSRGKILEKDLHEALAEQRREHRNLGQILVDMGRLTQGELARQISAKAQETVSGLFDWDDAIFRFHGGATLDPNHIQITLSVDNVVKNGNQRGEQLQEIRKVFVSSGIVLRRTERPIPEKLLAGGMARRILDSVDGQRTLAETLLHASASEFLVLKFLFELQRRGFIEIERQLPVTSSPTLVDVQRDTRISLGLDEIESDLSGGASAPSAPAPAAGSTDEDFEVDVSVATQLMGKGEYGAALDLLNAIYRSHPDENFLRLLLTKAEVAYVDTQRAQGMGSKRIPVLLRPAEEIPRENLGPKGLYLLSCIDGKVDIQSLLWLTPLREVDVMRALRKMLDLDLIELRDPSSVSSVSESSAPATA